MTHKMIFPINRALVDKTMGFLANLLAVFQSLALGEENQVVLMLADTILHVLRGQRRGTARIMLFDIVKGMESQVPLIQLVLIDFDLPLYLAALSVAALYKARNTVKVPKMGNIISLIE